MKKFVFLSVFTLWLFGAPVAPTGLILSPSTNQVSLSWQDKADNERGFKIYRDGKLIDFVKQNVKSYVDVGLSPDTRYKYEVKASDDFGFKLAGNIQEPSHISIFINSDNNAETGYTKDGIVGADILLQNETLYKRNTIDSSKWGWEKIGNSWYALSNNYMFMGFDEQSLAGEPIAEDAKLVVYNYAHDWKSKNTMQLISRMTADNSGQNIKQVHFTQTPKALKNPLKGFMLWPNDTSSSLKYVSLFKGIVHWRDIEETKNDGVEKIRTYSNNNMFNHRWDKYIQHNYSVEDKNIKVNPIVTLDFNTKKDYRVGDAFPEDMDISDHNDQTDLFVERIGLLVKKLAEAWDNDPRIGFVYMGITGRWGEQFYKIDKENEELIMSPSVITALGDSFTRYFKKKKVLVRHPKYFDKTYLESHNNMYRGNHYPNTYKLGMFWDAFAWSHEMNDGLLDTDEVLRKSGLWVEQPILGEVAFNANYTHIYDSYDYLNDKRELRDKKAIHDTLTHRASLDYLNDYIRSVHCTALTWIATYNEYDISEAKGAEEMQKTMGYRFVLDDASYPVEVKAGGELKVSFSVKNVGSAPFYYDWPVEVALLDKDSKQVVWSDRFKHVDIRSWQPGDDWDFGNNRYKKAAKTYTINESFTLPQALNEDEYILAISILDPASMKPAVKFAVTNYYNGGRTPLGLVGVGVESQGSLPAFDDLQNDGLKY